MSFNSAVSDVYQSCYHVFNQPFCLRYTAFIAMCAEKGLKKDKKRAAIRGSLISSTFTPGHPGSVHFKPGYRNLMPPT